MSKKSTRSGAQRNRAKVQKNVSLVRPNAGVITDETEAPEEVEETQLVVEDGVEESSGGVGTATATTTTTTTTTTITATPTTGRSRTRRASRAVATTATEAKESEASPTARGAASGAAPKGSASARMATRRQNSQKSQQRVAPTLITAEHYSYVRKDLIYIAILAILMFATIIVLHFVPGIGL